MGSQDGAEQGAAIATQPSFEGRLKLQDFMHAEKETGDSPVRRSTRLSRAASTAASEPPPLSKTASPVPARRSTKRKHDAHATSQETQAATAAAGTGQSAPSPKKPKRVPSTYAPPSQYAHLNPLQDILAPDLLVLFIGLNPGVQTARAGHAYAHPSNLFWKLLYSSGVTPVPCRPDEDRTLPARFGLGNTNIVARPSRNGAELSKAEMDEGVAVLEAKIRRWRPEVACIVGKSIWESVWRVRKGRPLRKDDFHYGWQDEAENMGVVPPGAPADGDGEEGGQGPTGPFGGARVFVATSTSGLAATLRPAEKERIWKELGDWCVQRRNERSGKGK